MKFFIASSNKNKFLEFQELFKDTALEILPPPEILTVEESGESYLENSLIKAKAYYNAFKTPIISDDSGLEITSLPGILGLKSERFEPGLSQEMKNKKILELLEGSTDRSAVFTAQLCFYKSPDEVYFFEGLLRGEISKIISGSQGFGYDPIFIPLGQEKTLAQMPLWKSRHSHRAKAVKEASKFWK